MEFNFRIWDRKSCPATREDLHKMFDSLLDSVEAHSKKNPAWMMDTLGFCIINGPDGKKVKRAIREVL